MWYYLDIKAEPWLYLIHVRDGANPWVELHRFFE